MIYEMIAGERAINGRNTFEALLQIDQLDAESLTEPLPDSFRRIIIQSLVHEPRQRTLTMADVAAILT